MKLAAFSVDRPIFTTMGALIIVILGGISFARLPVDLMPEITYPTLTVSTSYGNASPEEMEELVTRPIEEAMSAVPGVQEVTSTSTEGSSRVRISFAWGTDLDAASNDVRDRLDRVINHLPEDASRPSLRKFDMAAMPIMALGASSNLDPIEMRRIIDEKISYRIERVPGVAAMDVWGGLDREIHVNLDPDKIKALDVPLDQIVSRVRAGNVNVPAGAIERGDYDVMVRTPGQYEDLDQLRNTVIAMRQGVPVRLKEVASIDDTSRKRNDIVRVNGRPGIRLSISKQSGANTVQVARAVRTEIARINEDIPQIRLVTMMDTADYIERSVRNVWTTALYGGVLAVLVLLFFLRNVRSTAVIATAIPLSITATFILVYFCGFTLNLMTLGGLALGIGMMVDNSIVVLENIYRLRESGESARAAAINGTNEVTAAIIASTLTTVVVFLPMIFVRGMSGVLFKQLAYVIGFSLLCSLVVALTIVPMLAARLIQPTTLVAEANETLGHKIFRVSERAFRAMELSYKHALDVTLNHRFLAVVVPVLLLGGSIALIPLVGVEFMPKTDEGEVQVTGEMEVGTRLEVTDQRFRPIEEMVTQAVPEAARIVTTVQSGGGHGSGSSGQMRIALKPVKDRTRSSEQIAAALGAKLKGIPGVTIRTRAGQGLFVLRMGTGGSEAVQIDIRGHDLEVADALAQRVKDVVSTVDGVTDVRLSRESGTPEELVRVDRQKAADLKLTVSEVANTLETALSGTRASDFREGGNEYPIMVQLSDAGRLDLRDVLDLTVTNADGKPVVLRNVVASEPHLGAVSIGRKNQERVVTVSANISGRDMGSVIADASTALRLVPVPQGFSILFSGDYEEQQKAFRELLLSITLALVLVYMVMACQYESLRDPFVVMFSVPLATIGVILMLFLTGTTFNVQSFIGCIMLGGIVVNNAILLVDHTNLLRRRDGMALREAIEEAGRRRLRPIMMTALTTICCLLPLALALGEGSETQAPLARAVIGGLTSALLITPLFVPVMYSIFERHLGKKEH